MFAGELINTIIPYTEQKAQKQLVCEHFFVAFLFEPFL